MLCPACKSELKMSERSGVEIDYCPQCRGVWLDRGELDKIIERSTTRDDRERESDSDRRDVREYPEGQKSDHHARRKRGFFGELFDFD